jgi:hypothetical protein
MGLDTWNNNPGYRTLMTRNFNEQKIATYKILYVCTESITGRAFIHSYNIQ